MAAFPALVVNGVSVRATDGRMAVRDATFEVRTGEIMGVAGVSGNGQTELLEAVLGLRPLVSGEVHIAGDDINRAHPVVALRAGAIDVPEDPVGDAVIPGSARCSSTSCSMDARCPSVGSVSTGARCDERTPTNRSAKRLSMADLGRRVDALSGGNVQRVMLTRAFTANDVTLLVAAYPSRGLDIASVRETQKLLLERRAAGAAVLMVSEDLDELLMVADRIVVLHGGHVAGIVDAVGADRQQIGQLMLEGADHATEPAA